MSQAQRIGYPRSMHATKTTRLRVLASGSSGNCTLLEVASDTSTARVLIDLGLSPRRTAQTLQSWSIPLDSIDAAIITHLDSDHCHAGWRRASCWPIHLHRVFLPGACRSGLGQLIPFDESFAPAHGLVVEPMLLSHDELGVAVFRIQTPAGSLGFATDVGALTSDLIDHLRGVDTLAIESNYCPRLQQLSDRPAFLKARIMGGRGHLSNEQCCRAIELIEPARRVVLLHLSRQCNDPDLVADLHTHAPYDLTITDQFEPTAWIDLAGRPQPASTIRSEA